jgi:fructose-1,6-bisphosphatase
MDIQPRELHMRSPLFIGSKHMVERIESLLAKEQIKVQ